MSLLPLTSGRVQMTNTNSGSVYQNGFKMNGASVVSSAGAHSAFNQGLSFDSSDGLRILDSTAGLPAGVTWQNGLPLSSSGQLCVSTNAVSTFTDGLPLDSSGAVCYTAV